VTVIVDGDTIDINNVRVRLTLVNTPERGESGYTKAIDLVESACGVGTYSLQTPQNAHQTSLQVLLIVINDVHYS
jgi:hypothetical protein